MTGKITQSHRIICPVQLQLLALGLLLPFGKESRLINQLPALSAFFDFENGDFQLEADSRFLLNESVRDNVDNDLDLFVIKVRLPVITSLVDAAEKN